MATSGLDPRIIVLALGAGALGFPDALKYLVGVAGRSPVTDVAICVFAMAVVTAQALGAMLLARFVRKAQARAGDAVPPRRADRFARVTLVVSLAVAFLVSACLLAASGAGAGARGLGLVADVAREMVIAALATAAAAAAAAAAASSSTGTGRFRFASMARVATFAGAAAAAAFLLDESAGGLFMPRGSAVGVAAAVVGTLLLARFTFTRRARNAAGAGGRAAPAPAADTWRVGVAGKLTRLAPYLAVVSFVALIICCCIVLTHGCAARERA